MVTLIPNDAGLTYLNGTEIQEPKVLKTGSRIILGNNHVFRFTDPEEGGRGSRCYVTHVQNSVYFEGI